MVELCKSVHFPIPLSSHQSLIAGCHQGCLELCYTEYLARNSNKRSRSQSSYHMYCTVLHRTGHSVSRSGLKSCCSEDKCIISTLLVLFSLPYWLALVIHNSQEKLEKVLLLASVSTANTTAQDKIHFT